MRCYNLILYYILWFVKTILGKTSKNLRQPPAYIFVNTVIKCRETRKNAEVDEMTFTKNHSPGAL